MTPNWHAFAEIQLIFRVRHCDLAANLRLNGGCSINLFCLTRDVSVPALAPLMGGPGLILLGIADNSVIPLTGSMDVLTIWLAANHREPWPYYAFMATVGAVLGGYITYRLAHKGGKETLERKLSKRTAAKVHERFERWGFYAIAVPAILPPPFPIVPFLLAAGAMQYPPRKFLTALTMGRAIRFTILASLGARLRAQPYREILCAVLQTGAGDSDWPRDSRRRDVFDFLLPQPSGAPP